MRKIWAMAMIIGVILLLVPLSRPLDSSRKYVVLTFDDGCPCRNGDQAASIMNEYGYVGVLFTPTRTFEWLGTSGHQALLDKGWELGSHSYTHPNLNKLSQSQLQYELVDSVTKLESLFNVEVISFGYPSSLGSDNQTVLSYLQKAGVLYAREHMVHKNWNGSESLQINSYCMAHKVEADGNYVQRTSKLIADVKANGIAVAMFHFVKAALDSNYGTLLTTEFRWILNQIKSNGLVPITFKQLKELNNQPSFVNITVQPFDWVFTYPEDSMSLPRQIIVDNETWVLGEHNETNAIYWRSSP